eukprot:11290-Heterococcus_DN1.PRE.4
MHVVGLNHKQQRFNLVDNHHSHRTYCMYSARFSNAMCLFCIQTPITSMSYMNCYACPAVALRVALCTRVSSATASNSIHITHTLEQATGVTFVHNRFVPMLDYMTARTYPCKLQRQFFTIRSLCKGAVAIMCVIYASGDCLDLPRCQWSSH